MTMDNYNNHGRLWFLPLITGILFIVVGIWIFKTPMESYLTLSIFFAVTFLISGLFRNHSRTKQYPSPQLGLVSCWRAYRLIIRYHYDLFSLAIRYCTGIICRLYYFIPFLYEYRICPEPQRASIQIMG